MSDEGSRLFDEAFIARRRLQRWAAAAGAVLVMTCAAAELAPAMRRPDLALLDTWQTLRGTRNPSPQVVVVGIDEKSLVRFGPPAWPRSEYVALIDRLAGAGARAIGFDFTFGTLEREATNNRLLADAMRRAGNVVFGYEFTRVGDPSPPEAPPSSAVQGNALARFESVAIPPAAALIEPEPVLAEAAAVGHVRVVESEDGRIRFLPLVIEHGGKGYPSLAVQVARVYTGTPMAEVGLRDGVLEMGEWDIPMTASGEALLNWPAAGERSFTQYSFLDVVRGDVPDEAFRGKAVLVGGTAPGLDDRDLPFAVEAPGVLVYATFLDNVLRVDFVQAPLWAWPLEWGLFLVLCGLGVWVLPRLSTRLLLVGVPILVLLVLGGAAFLFVQKGVWVKSFYPVLALLVPMGVLVVLRLTASEREARDVGAEKVENQKLLGLSFQEKGMLDMALATFGKLPFTEDMKLVYVNLGLDYENRGQRDKALLVYQKVHATDPGFGDVARRMERLGFAVPGAPVGSPAAASAQLAAAGPTLSGSASTALGPAQAKASGAPAGAANGGLGPTLVDMAGDGAGATANGMGQTLVEGATGGPPIEPDSPLEAPTSQMPPTRARTPGAGTGTPARTPAPLSAPAYVPAHTPGAAAGPAPSGPVLPGTRFGRYEVERHLGRGGMGDVYLVRDTVINRKAALKTIRVDTDLDPQHAIEMRQRFYREGQTAGQLTHPSIVTVHDLGEALGLSYIVMEYVEGQTLAQLMKKQRLSVAQIKHVLYHAGMGLDYAHQNGIFHRDVKPDNIMITKGGMVKVMDFGIARITESELTKTGSVMGTPAYMSPEQVNGEKIDARSDIFSLGVILYELLTGKKPFTGETIPSLMLAIIRGDWAQPSAVDAKIPSSWDEILRKALARDREQRYASARELAQAVRDAPAR